VLEREKILFFQYIQKIFKDIKVGFWLKKDLLLLENDKRNKDISSHKN